MSAFINAKEVGSDFKITCGFSGKLDAVKILQNIVEHISKETRIHVGLLLNIINVGHKAYELVDPDVVKKTSTDDVIALMRELEQNIEPRLRGSDK